MAQIAATLTLTDIIPSSKTITTFKYPNYDSGKVLNFLSILPSTSLSSFARAHVRARVLVQLEFQYFHPHASLTAAVTHHRTPPIDFSATLGTPTFALGAEAGYETTSRKLTKYTAGITVTKPDSCASIIL